MCQYTATSKYFLSGKQERKGGDFSYGGFPSKKISDP